MENDNTITEIWKDIVGWEGYYQINNRGEVRSLTRVTSHSHKRIGKTLKPVILSTGYTNISLSRGNKIIQKLIHRLVGEAFIPNPNNLPQINHLNGIRRDNRVENLEWVNPSRQALHALEIGLAKTRYGEQTSQHKLKDKDIRLIRMLYSSKTISQSKLAIKFKVSRSNIEHIVLNKTWTHIK